MCQCHTLVVATTMPHLAVTHRESPLLTVDSLPILTPSRRHRLAAAKSSVGALLASSNPGYPFRKQPNKLDWLPGSVPHAHIATIGVDRLC